MTSRPLHILFRADASNDIGSGHVMRCLTLANTLAKRGARCTFLCRALRGNMIDQISSVGHAVHTLAAPVDEGSQRTDVCDYLAWLGVPVADDARDCREIIDRLAPDRVVVDHYAIDKDWEIAACGKVPVMAIDDLANRAHRCDILLDQNLGRKSGDYDGLVPQGAVRLIGPMNALLRPDFAAARPSSLARRSGEAHLKRLLISMGGVDRDNATAAILDVLADLPLTRDLAISVVMGSAAPWLTQVRARAMSMPCPVEVLVDVRDMATRLTQADLAIGAAGGSAWERCCLGVPTLMLTLADNQKPAAQALAATGAATLLGDVRDVGWQDALVRGLTTLAAPAALTAMSAAAASVCDGNGTERVIMRILTSALSVRSATEADARAIWEWRNAGDAAHFYQFKTVTPFDEHLAWLRKALKTPNRTLLIIERSGEAIGHVRIDRDPSNAAEAVVSICVSPAIRGQKLSHPILLAGIEAAFDDGVRTVHATVHRKNEASMRLFAAAGFHRISGEGEFINLALEMPGGTGSPRQGH